MTGASASAPAVASAREALVEAIDAALPQTQCRRCGEPDCRRYAEALADGRAEIDRCPPGGADDAVDRAGLDAQRAADAQRLVDHRQPARALLAAGRVERARRAAGDPGEPHDALGAAGRAAVDLGAAVGQRLSLIHI